MGARWEDQAWWITAGQMTGADMDFSASRISAARLFRDAIDRLELHLRVFEAEVPAPAVMRRKNTLIRRYKEQTPKQAMVLKYAGYLSGLGTVDTLLGAGFLCETVPVTRGLDEILDDISLVAGAIATGRRTELSDRLLADFWHEPSFGGDGKLLKSPKPPTRREIRDAVGEVFGMEDGLGNAGNLLYKFGSRSTHSTAAPLLDLSSPTHGRMEVRGIRHAGLVDAYIGYAWNVFYRGHLAAQAVAIGLGLRALGLQIAAEGRAFVDESGRFANC